MAFIGVPYRITYLAKNAQSGLNSVVARVLKPNGDIVGPLVMTEVTDSNFSGVYTATFTTTNSDSEGNYVFSVSSPEESTYKTLNSVFFENKISVIGSGSGGGGGGKLVATLKSNNLRTFVGYSKEYSTANLSVKKLVTRIEKNRLKAIIKKLEISGSIK